MLSTRHSQMDVEVTTINKRKMDHHNESKKGDFKRKEEYLDLNSRLI